MTPEDTAQQEAAEAEPATAPEAVADGSEAGTEPMVEEVVDPVADALEAAGLGDLVQRPEEGAESGPLAEVDPAGMHEIPLARLKPIPTLPVALMHQSGAVLLEPNAALDEATIDLLKSEGVENVVLPKTGATVAAVRQKLRFESKPIQEVIDGGNLARNVYDRENRLLLAAGSAVPRNFADSLARREIYEVFFERPEEQLNSKQGRKLRRVLHEGRSPAAQMTDVKTVEALKNIKMETASADDLDPSKMDEKLEKLGEVVIENNGPAFAEQLTERNPEKFATKEEKQVFNSAMGDVVGSLRTIFDQIENGRRKVDLDPIDAIATSVMAGTIKNRELLMLFSSDADPDEYLIHHAMATTIVAVNMGTTLGYDAGKIKSLAYGAALADVGMLKVPKAIREKKGKLNPIERAELRRHTAFGLDLLQKVARLPVELPFIVYQTHERANGTGYPGGKKDRIIHPFARIVAVADIYTAFCSERPHRPRKSPYEAMEHLLLLTGKRMLNRETVTALLKCNSMFPVGSFSILNDGRIVRTVMPNEDSYLRPVVSVIADPEGKLVPEPERINLKEVEQTSVVKALRDDDAPELPDPMFGF